MFSEDLKQPIFAWYFKRSDEKGIDRNSITLKVLLSSTREKVFGFPRF